jgi:molybdopterin-guanine dinucleotide biosynthesis protein A
MARQLSVRGLVEAGGAEIISESQLASCGFDRSLFRNINTEEDYRTGCQEPKK